MSTTSACTYVSTFTGHSSPLLCVKTARFAEDSPLVTTFSTTLPSRLLPAICSPVLPDHNGIADLQVSADLLALRNINTAAQVFDCTLLLQMRWSEEVVEGSRNEEGGNSWEPDIAFTNTVDDLRIQLRETRRRLAHSSQGTCVHAVHVMVVSGTFAEHYELRQFPMDCQRLHIKAVLLNCPAKRMNAARTSIDRSSNTSTWYSKRYQLTRGVVSMQPGSFLDTDSWQVIEGLRVCSGRSRAMQDSDAISYCTFTVHLTVERLCTYYFWNIVFPISLEGVMALFTCLLSAEDISTKTQVTVTIILTIFAVRFASTDYLPPVSCMTYLDKYFIAATLMACLVMAQNMLVYKLDEQGSARTVLVNFTTGTALSVFWVAMHACMYPIFLSQKVRGLCIPREVEDEDVRMLPKTSTRFSTSSTYDDDDYDAYMPHRGQPSMWSMV